MMKDLFFKFFTFILVFGLFLFSYIEEQNKITSLKMKIPKFIKDIEVLENDINKMNYDIDQFENPMNLLELASRCEFSHLKHPLLKNILSLNEGIALNFQKHNNIINAFDLGD